MILLTELNIKSQDIRISVPLRLHFVTKGTHLNHRIKERYLNEQDIANLVAEATQKYFNLVTISSIKDNVGLCAVDKQTCLVAHVILSNIKSLNNITALIKTAYIFNGKNGKIQKDAIYINEDNPSDEFLEAEQVAEWYGHLASLGGGASNGQYHDFIKANYDEKGNPLTYRAWDKYLDKENKTIQKQVNNIRGSLEQQMNALYRFSDKEKAKARKRDMHDAFNDHEREMKQFQKDSNKELKDALKDADRRILTPRGPNGSLRSIDKKAAKRREKQQQQDTAWKEHGYRDDSSKEKEMNTLWSKQYAPLGGKMNKKDSMNMLYNKHDNFKKKHNKWVHHDLQDALRDADRRILTPRGPNGSLRAIDRKAKKRKDESQELRGNTIIITESQLRDIIQKLNMGIL